MGTLTSTYTTSIGGSSSTPLVGHAFVILYPGEAISRSNVPDQVLCVWNLSNTDNTGEFLAILPTRLEFSLLPDSSRVILTFALEFLHVFGMVPRLATTNQHGKVIAY